MASPIAIPQSIVRIVRTDGFLNDDFEAHFADGSKSRPFGTQEEAMREAERLAGGALLVIDESLDKKDIDKEPEADSLETIAA